MVQSLKFIIKTWFFYGLESCMCERVSKEHQKLDQNLYENKYKIDTQIMLEKKDEKTTKQ